MGADDQAVASNHITPEKVLDAAKWIKDGKIYDSTMPFFGKRTFQLRIPGSPFSENRLVYHDEIVATRSGRWGPNSTAASATSAS
jgi:hypothetical protein